MQTIRVGLIGLGMRGSDLLRTSLLPLPQVKITAVCDVYQDRVETVLDFLKDKAPKAKGFTDYRELLASGLVDAVIVATAWESHLPIACAAMEAGIAVGSEVGSAYSLDDCYRLINTWERTKTPYMMLENCNYDRRETCLFAMIRAGVFGKIVACDGGYMHDLRAEVAGGERNRHYRQRNYIHRCAENYPTHELGPIMQMLDINRGNRMVSLVSVASDAFGLEAYMNENDKENPLLHQRIAQGDIVTTIITCARGETITLRLDTTLPRYYSRGIAVHGTKALYTEDNNTLFLGGEHEAYDFKANELWGNFNEYSKDYRNDDWREADDGLVVEGHGGMDYFMMRDFITRLIEKRPFQTDVYDAAAMMCITPLSEESIAKGGAPVAIPDFTKGEFLLRKQN
ncbi:MAG: Gfo/Idh/MocA family oxidoreductase [Ruminococcaceae bacterium]|nr:Gfo/Idh/MocA family oxidoreductase [Oscillospiraceae bacterium]